MAAAFQDFQRAFGAHLRDPRRVARPAGLPARRSGVYAELVFNNLCGFVDACFPVCRTVLGELRWRRLCRAFLRQHPLQTPWFREIPEQFAVFLAEIAVDRRLPRWLPELAHYEWAELAVDVMDVATPPHDLAGDLLALPVVLNPALLTLACAWPVHRIGPDRRPRRPQPTFLAVYRKADDSVGFCEINALTVSLLDRLRATPTTGRDALLALAAAAGQSDPTPWLGFGAATLDHLREQGIVLGTTA